MKSCSICKANIENEEPSILTMGGYGNPRYVCETCDLEIEKMLTAKDPDAVKAAMQILGDHLSRIGCEDNAVIQTMQEIMAQAKERAEKIREGTYDFSEDEQQGEDELVEIPEELKELEEDRVLDEKEAEAVKKLDKVMNWIWYVAFAAFGAIFAYLIVKKYF